MAIQLPHLNCEVQRGDVLLVKPLDGAPPFRGCVVAYKIVPHQGRNIIGVKATDDENRGPRMVEPYEVVKVVTSEIRWCNQIPQYRGMRYQNLSESMELDALEELLKDELEQRWTTNRYANVHIFLRVAENSGLITSRERAIYQEMINPWL